MTTDRDGGGGVRWRRWTVAMVVACAVSVGVSGCGIGEAVADRQEQVHRDNLAKQREAAVVFIGFQPDVEVVRFTQEGGRPGLGASWSANAVVTIGGKDYQMIIGPDIIGGDPLPDTPPSYSPSPVTVIFSDGTSEVLG